MKVLKIIYFQKSSFWESLRKKPGSWILRNLLIGRDVLKDHCEWVPGFNVLKIFQQGFSKVSSLISPSTKDWDRPLVQSVFPAAIGSRICSLKLPQQVILISWDGLLRKMGNIELNQDKIFWHLLCFQFQNFFWYFSPRLKLWASICPSQPLPKLKVFYGSAAWKPFLCVGIYGKKSVLLPLCPIYNKEKENIEQLFFGSFGLERYGMLTFLKVFFFEFSF